MIKVKTPTEYEYDCFIPYGNDDNYNELMNLLNLIFFDEEEFGYADCDGEIQLFCLKEDEMVTVVRMLTFHNFYVQVFRHYDD